MTYPSECRGVWSMAEHERFLEAVAMYPTGPWHLITAHVGTRSAKQVQTHAQKYQHKLLRHQRGLRKSKTKSKRPEHRVDVATIDALLRPAERKRERPPPPPPSQQYEYQHDHATYAASRTTRQDSGSDSSDWSDSSALDAVEPIPFRSATIASLTEQARSELREALDVILSWSPPSPESADQCV